MTFKFVYIFLIVFCSLNKEIVIKSPLMLSLTSCLCEVAMATHNLYLMIASIWLGWKYQTIHYCWEVWDKVGRN